MKVTETEVRETPLGFLDWHAYQLDHQFQWRERALMK